MVDRSPARAHPVTVLLTGGSGFFGSILKAALLQRGHRCVNLDLVPDDHRHPGLVSVRGDVRDRETVDGLFRRHRFGAVVHLAAVLAHDVGDGDLLWTSNVDGTAVVAEAAARHGVRKVVFTSSNCLWGTRVDHPVREEDPARPAEIYGRSKLAAEHVLLARGDLEPVILRCPTIVDAGRLGLLTLLFEFIEEGRRVWLVGGGHNRYQFVHAGDLVDACVRALEPGVTGVFNVGADDVASFREVYAHVIARAGTGARLATVPRTATLALLRVAHRLGLSPLGPYQQNMIAEDFLFDTSKIKRELGWRPTTTNQEMLYEAYRYWHDRREEIEGRTEVSAHRRGVRGGALRLLKLVS